MHSCWLVETASLWGYHSSALIGQRAMLPVEAVNEYWVNNRCRFDAWNAMLTRFGSRTLSMSAARRIRAWDRLQAVIQEVLLAEPLTRICVAVAAQLEERQIDFDARAILHNVYTTHCEIRSRCLKTILEGLDRGLPEAKHLNSIRYYLEHWIDMLLGYFAHSPIALEYAFSATRMEDFAEDFNEAKQASHASVVWSLQLASCRDWLSKNCKVPSMAPRLNQRVSEAALGMLHQNAFDSFGCMRSRLIQSIEYGIDHADRTVASLESDSWESISRVLKTSNSKPARFECP